jgi:hypothetical protein
VEQVPLGLLDAGWYQGILSTARIDFGPPVMAEVRTLLADLASHQSYHLKAALMAASCALQ